MATMTKLERRKQGPFIVEDCLAKDDWTADNIYNTVRKFNDIIGLKEVEFTVQDQLKEANKPKKKWKPQKVNFTREKSK